MKKFIFFITLVGFTFNIAQGQEDKSSSSEAPTKTQRNSGATAKPRGSSEGGGDNGSDVGNPRNNLSANADINVGYYTGIPNIEIPIYTIVQDGVSIPIKLRYISTGVKVDDTASRVGLGWVLDTGGEINREEKGIVDMDVKPVIASDFPDFINVKAKHFSEYGYDSPEKIAMRAIGIAKPSEEPCWKNPDPEPMIPIDLEPDLYSYSILGSSGSFIISPQKRALPIPYSDNRIDFHPNSLEVKTITDHSGVKYNFVSTLSAIPVKNNYPPQYTTVVAPYRWGLQSITTPNGYSVSYEYDKKVSYDNVEEVYTEGYNKHDFNAEKTTEDLLTRISFSNGSIQFIYDNAERTDQPGDYALREIKVLGNQNHLIKHFILNYDYFASSPEDLSEYKIPSDLRYNTTQRLKLKNVVEELSNALYSFQYNEDKPLAPRLSKYKDKWGGNNGRKDEDPNVNFAKSGILKVITYPTGGKTELTYELDDYFVPEERIEGLESRSISADNDTPEVSFTVTPEMQNMTFQFSRMAEMAMEAGFSKGQVLDDRGNVIYELNSRNNTIKHLLEVNRTYKLKVYYGFYQGGNALIPGEPAHIDPEDNFGSMEPIPVTLTATWSVPKVTVIPAYNKEVGGLRVKEIKNYDAHNALITQKQYSYNDPNTGFSSAQVLGITENNKAVGYHYVSEIASSPQGSYKNQYQYFIDKEIKIRDIDSYRRGALLEIKSFNSQGQLIYKKDYNYDFNDGTFNQSFTNRTDTQLYKAIYLDVRTSGCNYPDWELTYGFNVKQYKITSAWVKLLQQRQTQYFYKNNKVDSLFTQTSFSYSPEHKHNYPVEISITNNLGEVSKTQYQYPQDLINQEPYMDKLAEANRISTPVITSTFENNIQTSQSKLKFAETADRLVLPSQAFLRSGSQDINESQNLEQTYNKYDARGNILQSTKENGIPVSFIWGYSGQYPIAKIEGATYDEVSSYAENLQKLSDSGNEAALIIALNNLRNNLPQHSLTTYTYKPLVGVTSTTSPHGITEYYSYDSAGRLKEVKDKDQKLIQSFEYNYKQ